MKTDRLTFYSGPCLSTHFHKATAYMRGTSTALLHRDTQPRKRLVSLDAGQTKGCHMSERTLDTPEPQAKVCELVKTKDGFGGFKNPRQVKCQNVAAFNATEINPDPVDGTYGSMMLCGNCRDNMERIMGEGFAAFSPI